MHIQHWIFKHHTVDSNWGVDIKFNEFLTSTPDRVSVLFHSPVYLLSMKEPSEITKQGVEIWYDGKS